MPPSSEDMLANTPKEKHNGQLSQKYREIKFHGLEVNISEEQNHGKSIDIISFHGRIDSQNAYKLNRQAHNSFFKWDKDIIIGLADLEYINSVGIAILFSIFHRQKGGNKQVAIGGIHPFLNQVFELVHLPPQVLLLDTIEAAKQALL